MSRTAVDKGFSFEVLGRALMGLCKKRLPQVETMEVLFVTSCREDVEPLETIAAQVAKISRDIRRKSLVRRLDGTYECMTAYRCDACSEKPICDDVRRLVALRKAKGRRFPQPRNPDPGR